MAFSNVGTSATSTVALVTGAQFFTDDGTPTGTATAAAVPVDLQPMEVQILGPE